MNDTSLRSIQRQFLSSPYVTDFDVDNKTMESSNNIGDYAPADTEEGVLSFGINYKKNVKC